MGGYFDLLADILKAGVHNPDYFREPCGRFWASVGGLDPAALWEKAVRDKGLIPLRYKPLGRCLDPEAWSRQEQVGVTPKNFEHTVGVPGWKKPEKEKGANPLCIF